MTLNEKWAGEIQVDFGPIALGERLLIRDAYLQYRRFQDRGITITLDNQKMPFSRSLLASASRRSLVERPLTGDKTLGAPGRSIGLKVDGRNRPGTIEWSGALASALHAPNASTENVDLDHSFGLEVSDGLRANRVSVDAEFHRVTGDTIDPCSQAGSSRPGTRDCSSTPSKAAT